MFEETNTTADESTPNRSRQNSIELTKEQVKLQRIIESNEEIIFEQSKQITHLSIQLAELKKRNGEMSRRLEVLDELVGCQPDNRGQLESINQRLLQKVGELEQLLVVAKIESATKESEILTAKYELKKMKAENKRRSLKIEDNDYDHLSKSKIVHLIDSDVKIRLELDISLVPKSEHFTDADLKSWTKYLEIDHPFKCLALQKFKEKTKQLIRKYIPSQLRNKIWPLLIHDRLALTRPFYNDLLENNVLPEKVKSQIAKDIDRSFPNNGELNSCKDLLSNMQEMLEEFHCYRPDISYVQGMTYPAAILLLVTLDKFVAFKCFCNIIVSNELLRSLYSFDLKKISLYCRAFDALLEDSVPWLFEQLNDLGIDTEMFLIQWFYTMFGRAFTLPIVLRVWDLFVFYGEVIFFRTALSIFELLQEHLKGSSYEKCIASIKGFGQLIKEQKVLEAVAHSKITTDKLHIMLNRVGKCSKDFQDDNELL